MRGFSQRATDIQPTGVRKMFDMAGDDVISFGLGEPDFQPPKVAIDAMYQVYERWPQQVHNHCRSSFTAKKIAETWHSRCPGLDESNVCMTMSGTNALLNIFASVVNPGDNVLLPEPYFPLYGPDVGLWGGEPKFYQCLFENEFIPTIDHLESLIDENTVAILYNFPSNPTGATITIEQRMNCWLLRRDMIYG